MPFFKRFFLSILFIAVQLWPLSAQKSADNVLTRKYAPAQLREDVRVMTSAILKMHPVIGIYQSREYYVAMFDSLYQTMDDSLTEKEFRIKLKIVLDQLHCGHTEVISSKEYVKASNKIHFAYSPYVFMPIKNKVFMLAALNRKKDTLIRRGSEITKINGISSDSMLKVCRKLITTDGYNVTGKDHYVKLGFNNYYPAVFGRTDTFNIEYRTGKNTGNIKYPAIKVKSFPPIPLGAKDDSVYTVFKRSRIKYKYIDSTNKTMVLKIFSFSRKSYKRTYRKIFKKLERNNTENLVIDLRYNGGGSLENSYRLLSYLIDSARTQTLKTGIRNYPDKKYTSGNVWFKLMRFGFKMIAKRKVINDTDNYIYTIKPRDKYHYNKKVFVLINGGSFSASCLVAAYLKDKNRAVFVGEETSGAIEGCNAGITPYYKLPNTQVKIRVPAFRIVHDVSPKITGHGIIPDYKIEYNINDILYRRDLELDKVKELIKQ